MHVLRQRVFGGGGGVLRGPHSSWPMRTQIGCTAYTAGRCPVPRRTRRALEALETARDSWLGAGD